MAEDRGKRKIAWGITGSGDRIEETVEAMIKLQKQYDDDVDVRVFVSKAGEQVIKYYKLFNILEKHFDKVWVEINANSPFLAGQLQVKRYEFLLLAPATSNTRGFDRTHFTSSAWPACRATRCNWTHRIWWPTGNG